MDLKVINEYTHYHISKEVITFAAAHRLLQLPKGHKCRNLHGHNWKAVIDLYSNHLDKYGFVMDFGKFKDIKKEIDNTYDHAVLIANNDNELIEFCVKTDSKHVILPYSEISAENLASNIFYQHVLPTIPIEINKIIVTVYETETSKASFIYEKKGLI